jgi:hypothetical protein
MYPSISLDDFVLDEKLVRRLSRQLAYYHLALPIGSDEEGITVAMAQPDNVKARQIVQNALGEPIILTRGQAEQIRRCLDRVWQTSLSVPWSHIAVASDDPLLESYARHFVEVFGSLRVENGGPPPANTLLIRPLTDSASISLASSTLLVDRFINPVQRILHLVRLHSPDRVVAASLIPLAAAHSARITLLPDTSLIPYNLAGLMNATTGPGQHLEMLRQQFWLHNVPGDVRLKQGSYLEAIHAELGSKSYDLVAVAADADGEMVAMLTDAIRPYQVPAMMVIRPNLPTAL